jgi:membrane dipeptidase
VAAAGCSAPESIEVTEADSEAVARGIHERVITIDTHDDIPANFATAEVDPGVRGDRQVDLPKMREGGLDVAFFVVYVGQGDNNAEGYAGAYEQAMSKFAAIHRMTEEMYPDSIELATNADDVERIVGGGKLAAAIGIENGWPVGEDLANLAKFKELGGGYFGLVHNGHNQIADSTNPRDGEPAELHGGVSDYGAEVIAEVNRVGMMLDMSHASKAAMLEALELSQAPVIGSHSACSALCDVSRNMDDEQLLALRDNGGVIQMVALADFVKVTAEGDPAYPAANVADFVDHIDYAVNLIGLDHVGISSDFDGGGGVVGWNDSSETFNVTRELVERGYSEEQIGALWGGNLLRVWREVEEVARSMQASGAN